MAWQGTGRCHRVRIGAQCVVIGLMGVSLASCGQEKPVQPLPAKAAKTAAKAHDKAEELPPLTQDRGKALYAQHCLACHGEKGDGKGLAAAFLFPKPRDFRTGRFRLISTDNFVPTTSDLDQVLVRGMPGSAMISWAHLNETDRKLLAEEVLGFRHEGARDVELALAIEADEELSEDELDEAAQRMITPGEVLDPPVASKPTPEAIERGRELYKSKGCIACHGQKGKGDGQQKMVDAEGLPTRPRDLTLGIFKGAPDYASVYRRIWLGMPGSPMPSSQKLTSEEVGDMVHFVRSLSDEATRDVFVLKRSRIPARRVAALPAALTDDAWRQFKPVRLAMTPLWWRDDADPDLRVQAVHDGAAIALRVSWNDPRPDLHAVRSEAFEDAVAVELYRGPAEPFLGMGARDSAVDVWMWDADSFSGGADVEEANPRIVVDSYPLAEATVASAEFDRPGTKTSAQDRVTLPALATGNQIFPSADAGAAQALEGAGPGSLTFRLPRSQLVRSQAEWNDGRWKVMLTRVLRVPPGDAGLSLKPGTRASIAIAVWNGSHRDRDGQKLVTIWQDLVLEK